MLMFKYSLAPVTSVFTENFEIAALIAVDRPQGGHRLRLD